MDAEVTVAELVAREGRTWPPIDPDREPRHLLVEPDEVDEPDLQSGELVAWFNDEPAALVRQYVLPRQENHDGC